MAMGGTRLTLRTTCCDSLSYVRITSLIPASDTV